MLQQAVGLEEEEYYLLLWTLTLFAIQALH